MKFSICTEPGGGKRENEDVIVTQINPTHSDCLVCVLADGQGGQSHGAAAARAACETARDAAAKHKAGDLINTGVWPDILAEADIAASRTGGYSTLIAFVCVEGVVCGASCGDSKVFLKEPGGRIIELTKHQRKNPPVGSGGAIFEIFRAESNHGGRVLAASDGVWKYCGYEAIESALRMKAVSEIAAFLRNAVAPKNGGPLPDDFSFVVVEL